MPKPALCHAMKEFAIKFVKSKTFKALVGVIAAALSAYAATGCGVFSSGKPAVSPVQACQAAVLAPFVRAAVERLAAGEPADRVLRDVDPAKALAVAEAFRACSAPAPAADAGVSDAGK